MAGTSLQLGLSGRQSANDLVAELSTISGVRSVQLVTQEDDD